MKGECEGESKSFSSRGRPGLFCDHLSMKLVGKYVDKARSVGVVSLTFTSLDVLSRSPRAT